MNLLLVVPYYLAWHYGRAYSDIRGLLSNFLGFFYHFFSIPTLLRTLFSPWQRIHESYKTGSIVETLIFNVIMRVIGVFARILFIVIGIVVLLFTFVFGFAFFFIWTFVPFILFGGFMWGFREILL